MNFSTGTTARPTSTSLVDKFMLDFTTDPPGTGPDSLPLTSWNGRIGGVYLGKSNFPANIDWKHITYVKLLQNFNSLPNPTIYSVTNFYATIQLGASPPADRVNPLSILLNP